MGATLITIGVGNDVDEALLRTIASPGDGPGGKLFFPGDDFGDLDIEQLVCCSIGVLLYSLPANMCPRRASVSIRHVLSTLVCMPQQHCN